MKIIKLSLGQLQTNCYLLKQANNVVIIDPGSEAQVIINNVEDNESVVGIVLTHGHFDHIGAVNDLIDHYNCPFYVSREDALMIKNPHLSYQESNFIHYDPQIIEEEELTIENFSFTIHKTPGHTQGSILIEWGKHLFTGDTLFKNGIGRTDLATGNYLDMERSLKKIKEIDKDLIIHPGHGEDSTLANEKLYNPYLRRIDC